MKFTEKNIGQRVQLKRDGMLNFKVGDVGTIKAVDGLMYAVHFDIARDGWERDDLGIPALHGLYVYPEDLRKVPKVSKLKAKNAVVGTRVQIKKGVRTGFYSEGQTGVIEKLSTDDDVIVRFDHDNDHWYVPVGDLKRIKE